MIKRGDTDLRWVDDFWRRAGPHIFARTEDGTLILPPNRVYKVNESGARLVDYLRSGGRFGKGAWADAEKKGDIAAFFGDLAALYRDEAPMNGTVSEIAYGFGFTKLPILAELAVSYRCNNACRFCYAGCGGTAEACRRHPEQTTEVLKTIIDIFADQAKVPFFSFTGGEPCCRDDLEELIAYAASRKLVTNLVTNGTLIDKRRAKRFRRAGLGSAQVSVEASDAKLHDYLVGRDGAFKQTLAGIAALRSEGIPVQTNTTLTRVNLAVGPLMPAFLSSLGVTRFAMNMFIPTEQSPETEELFIPYSEIGAVVDRVVQAAKAARMVFYWYSPTPFCLYNPIARGLGNKSCAAADGLLSVAPDGKVLPCSSWEESLGDLTAEPFKAVWFSPVAERIRRKEKAPDDCRDSCGAFVACQGACPLYWRYIEARGLIKERRALIDSRSERSAV